MTGAVKDLLNTFDALTASEEYEAASQVLRRVIEGESGEIPEDALVAAAEHLFLDLDARESGNDQSWPRCGLACGSRTCGEDAAMCRHECARPRVERSSARDNRHPHEQPSRLCFRSRCTCAVPQGRRIRRSESGYRAACKAGAEARGIVSGAVCQRGDGGSKVARPVMSPMGTNQARRPTGNARTLWIDPLK